MRHRESLIDRDREVDEVAQILGSTGTSAQTLLITGQAGVGKTAMLERARLVATRNGAKVVTMNWEDTEEPPGVAALADAVCDVLARIHDGWLPARITAVRRVQWRITHRAGESILLKTMGEVLADAAQSVPFAVVLDDVQRMPSQTASALGAVLRAFRPTDIPVVMAGRPVGAGWADGGGLAATADRVLELRPLPPSGIGELAAWWAGCPVEPALLTALSRVLGPLAGNPEAVLSLLTCWRESGSLVELDGRLCLTQRTDLLDPVSRPDGLLRLVRPDMAAESVELAATLAHLIGGGELRLDDLRFMGPHDGAHAESVAASVDQLVKSQVLTVDGDRRLSFPVPALATTLRTLPVRSDLPGVHAQIVKSVTDRMDAATAGARSPYLADHVEAAGSLLDDELAIPLLFAAARNDARSALPRAARAYRSALRRLPPGDPRTPALLREAAELSLRYADYEGVLELGQPLLACVERWADSTSAGDPSAGHGTALQVALQSWVFAVLHEHRLPFCQRAGARYRTALEPMPAVARAVSIAALYGIGPVTLTAWDDEQTPTSTPTCGYSPLPAPAELRLMAAAVGSKAQIDSARQALPSGAVAEEALDRLRNAAAYGDLAGAFATVLGERYTGAGHSTAIRYQAMVRDYLKGRWDSALTSARRIETRSRPDGAVGPGQLARALAAEIYCMRGELRHAHAWLDLIPDNVIHPLVDRVRIAVRYWSGQTDEALAAGWRDARRARKNGTLAGVERVLLRILMVAALEDRPETAQQALEELEALHKEAASPMSREAVLIGRGMVHRDADSLLAAHRSLTRRGDAPLGLLCSYGLLEVGDDPQPWLTEVKRISHMMAIGRPVRAVIDRTAQRRNISLPRRRSASKGLSDEDITLIEMISGGLTNRQIAARLACSEKTVEQRLTRIFRRTGCPSRVKLAAAWLDGTLVRLGLVPDTGGHHGAPAPGNGAIGS
ncbi:LuxR family transcriptional regulator [Streptomyces mirabilis]|uniref:LuxR family transcriptional regulator n=1 Tax=Streptomyces mirabilis TaxID=68239 RepID=UPI0034106624